MASNIHHYHNGSITPTDIPFEINKDTGSYIPDGVNNVNLSDDLDPSLYKNTFILRCERLIV